MDTLQLWYAPEKRYALPLGVGLVRMVPAEVRRTVVGGARVVSGAEKKKHFIEAAPFGRLNQMC